MEPKERPIDEVEAFSRVLAEDVSKRGISRGLRRHNQLQLMARYYIYGVDRCVVSRALGVSSPLVDKIYSHYSTMVSGAIHNLRRKYHTEIYDNRIAVIQQAGQMGERRSL